jgi:hypothetical protein
MYLWAHRENERARERMYIRRSGRRARKLNSIKYLFAAHTEATAHGARPFSATALKNHQR